MAPSRRRSVAGCPDARRGSVTSERGGVSRKSGAIWAQTRIPLIERFFPVAQSKSGLESASVADLDLFGNPVAPIRDPRGRPSYAKSKENQMLVISLAGRGWRHAQIAAFMGCDEKTLRKHFSRELDHGALFLEGMAMQVFVKKMLDGNMAATRAVMEIAGAQNAPKGKSPVSPRPVPVGKKEAATAEAKTPPQGWGDLLN